MHLLGVLVKTKQRMQERFEKHHRLLVQPNGQPEAEIAVGVEVTQRNS
jgi:hypothetical protein